jgi:hypothetical protein
LKPYLVTTAFFTDRNPGVSMKMEKARLSDC